MIQRAKRPTFDLAVGGSDGATLVACIMFWPERQYPEGDIGFLAPESFPAVTDSLVSRGYSDDDIRGILGENFLRVAGEVWK